MGITIFIERLRPYIIIHAIISVIVVFTLVTEIDYFDSAFCIRVSPLMIFKHPGNYIVESFYIFESYADYILEETRVSEVMCVVLKVPGGIYARISH